MPTSYLAPPAIASVNSARRFTHYGISYLLIACLGFIVLDMLNRLRPIDKLALPEKSAIWWATKHFYAIPPPDLVLLGSSLMIAAQNDCDATYFDRSYDAVTHYHSDFLESKLTIPGKPAFRTASFVIGGQMATDAYAIVKTIFKGKNRPQILVWGIAPRDFVDATFGKPEETETVRLMTKIGGAKLIFDANKITFWQKLDGSFGQLSSIYANRAELQTINNEIANKLLKATLPGLYFSNDAIPKWLELQVTTSYPEDKRLRQWIVRPCKRKGAEPKDNDAEYKSRYIPFKPELFDLQLHYYKTLLEQTHRQGIRVIIVNMPLRTDNLRLIPTGVYANYLGQVRKLALENSADFIDCNKRRDFSAQDFSDPVHLNGYGATKFMTNMAKVIASYRK